MKRIAIFLCLLSFLLLPSCTSKKNIIDQSASVTETVAVDSTDTEKQSTPSQTDPSTAENSPTSEIRSDVSSESNSKVAKDKPSEQGEKAEVTQKPETSEAPQSAESSGSPSPGPSAAPKPSSPSPSDESSQSQLPAVHYAGADDCKAVAVKLAEYINLSRSEQGVSPATVLPGLTEYAEYRSRQIVTNFAHDTLDERAAATALKYGEYIDPPLYGMTGESYYQVNAREAIAKAGYVGTPDTVARLLAQQIRDSAPHWTYVGSDEYAYIAVGITFQKGIWYCAVTVSSFNTDEI